MPEGHNFEKHEITLQPRVDFESILEKGEITSAKELKGYWGIHLVEIKDDGDALFRPDKETDFMFEAKGMEARRSDLELMAYRVDQVLEFNLVPTVTSRTVNDFRGSLQRRIQNFQVPSGNWENKVKPEELTRAAVFDYLLDVRDRHHGNFLIDSDTGKLWLIDHDFYMFEDRGEDVRTYIVKKAQEVGLVSLSGFETAALERFLAHADSLSIGAKLEVMEIIKRARGRAELLLEEGQIPTTDI